jgi:uncharacterized repeat protein (TIGR01451 family)
MLQVIKTADHTPPRDLAWRLILIGGMALLMCSCRTPGQTSLLSFLPAGQAAIQPVQEPQEQESEPVVVSISSAPDAVTNIQAVQELVAQNTIQAQPAPPFYPDNWRPPGLPGPWPADEYIRQGGDREQTVNVARDWSIDNLDSEDSVIHYHTLEGRLVVQPTNHLPIYAPRFGSVRRMDGMNQVDSSEKVAGVEVPMMIGHRNSSLASGGVLQQLQPQHNLVVRSSSSYRERTQGIDLHNRQNVLSDMNIRGSETNRISDQHVQLLNTAKPRLGKSAIQAEDKLIKQYAQVTVEGLPAHISTSTSGLGTVHTYHMPHGKSLLKITKRSSANTAQPGDTIEFTIEFENVGTQDVGNVTVVDHLTSRLEYVEDSQESTLQANFFIQPSVQEGSTILRWEIIQPLAIKQGGQVTFSCRVR